MPKRVRRKSVKRRKNTLRNKNTLRRKYKGAGRNYNYDDIENQDVEGFTITRDENNVINFTRNPSRYRRITDRFKTKVKKSYKKAKKSYKKAKKALKKKFLRDDDDDGDWLYGGGMDKRVRRKSVNNKRRMMGVRVG